MNILVLLSLLLFLIGVILTIIGIFKKKNTLKIIGIVLLIPLVLILIWQFIQNMKPQY